MASISKKMLHEMYVEQKKSITDIAAVINKNYSSTRRLLIQSGIQLRSPADGVRAATSKLGTGLRGKKRVFSDEWKENMRQAAIKRGELTAKGVTLRSNGYLHFTRGPHKGRAVHVVIAEEKIGRPIRPDEHVHHIDHNPLNNDPDNLMVMNHLDHKRYHATIDAELRRRDSQGRFITEGSLNG